MLTTVHDRDELSALLGRDPALHVYELGDLDEFFWPYTTWYRLPGGGPVALVYTGAAFGPILIALSRPEEDRDLRALVTALLPVLPRRFFAHLTGGAEELLAEAYTMDDHGPHLKMALADLRPVDGEPTVVLTGADLPELRRLYGRAYPQNSFDPRMLSAGEYVGIRRAGELVAVAGVHIHSPGRRIAALGNVTTLPELRGQGLASVAVSALCRRLLASVDQIGLNVAAGNASATGLYERLGFVRVAGYRELMATAH